MDADVAADGAVRGVVIHNIEGCRYVAGRTFIDAPGDAVLAVIGSESPRRRPDAMRTSWIWPSSLATAASPSRSPR
ncbi:MAG: hypothetical protein ACLFVU_10145 [Phycisphaerae bacterium]